ncbi:MAG: Coenzyme F420 hydrogenase/dehydrogenase, beta subunit C-terminal domain [Nibricoccus sp.]
MGKIKTLTDVVDWRLCIGCGVCAYICPENRIQLLDYVAEGIRPNVDTSDCKDCTLCLDACPSVQTDFTPFAPAANDKPKDVPATATDFTQNWGQVLEVWEGHAADPEIRYKGSSGGVLTALAAYCVEKAGMAGVLHTGQDPEEPFLNRTRLSLNRQDLIAASGSRYAPASVCNGLNLVEQASAPCAIIGQPSEIAALTNARRLKPELDQKIGVTMSFFCAGSPPTKATTNLLKERGIEPSSIASLRYRGLGWPGHFAPMMPGQSEPAFKLTYSESWAILQASRPWSVQLWPDSSGELADISCGDPWYFQPDGVNPGSSLVLVRTQRGREILQGAIADGYVELKPAEAWKVEKSQSGLWKKKGAVWGRRFSVRLLGLPYTRFRNNHLFACWWRIEMRDKIRSVLGTLRRLVQRKFYRPLVLDRKSAAPVKTAVVASELLKTSK